MSIAILPYTAEWEDKVRAWNERLKVGQSGPIIFQFPERHESDWLPRGEGRKIYTEMFLAIEDGVEVRGGYCVKVQDFQIDGQSRTIGDLGLPLSEGIVDGRYWFLGPLLLKDALKRFSLIYGLGMGGLDNPLPRVMKAMDWSLTLVPFKFRLIRPARCLRQLRRLRSTRARRLVADALAVTGAGWLGAKAFDLSNRLRRRRPAELDCEVVEQFGAWVDDVWEASRAEYAFTAIRDRVAMNTLYGEPGSPKCIILKMNRGGRAVGWAMVRDTFVKDHRHFGDLRIGTLVDGFASPEDAPSVIAAATRFLERRGVDLIVTNQTHRAWLDGLDAAGYLNGPSNFALALSKPLASLAGPMQSRFHDYHFNRADGDGPINL